MKERTSVAAICREHGKSRQAYYQARQRATRRQAREEEAVERVK